MEDLLNKFWQHFKSHKGGAMALFLLILFGVLGFVALISDIGFGEEVKQYRYKILFVALGCAFISAFIWFLIFSVQEDKRLNRRIVELEREVNELVEEGESSIERNREKAEEISHLQGTILNLLQELTAGRVVEVIKVQFYKENLYLRLRKKIDVELKHGDEIRVLDKAEGNVMGVFEVSEVHPLEYVAKSSMYISPIWLGYIRQNGNAESSAPPDTIAIFYPKDGKIYE